MNRIDPPAAVLLTEEVWGSALHAMRSLGRAGAPVLVGTAGRGSDVFCRSRYCTAAADFEQSDPSSFAEAVRYWIEGTTKNDQPAVVIPLSDRLVDLLHRSRDSFPTRLKLAIPPGDVTAALLNKGSSLPIAEQAGLDVPAWAAIGSANELDQIESLRLPVIVRPASWASGGAQSFKLRVHNHRAALHDDVCRLLDAGARLIVQEYLQVNDDAVEWAVVWRSNDGSSTEVCTGRKRRQSTSHGGTMIWGETVSIPEVRENAIRFLDESQFTGVGGIEFIRRDGRMWFIEFNPRLEAIHFLAGHAGIDTVLMLYEDLALGQALDRGSGQVRTAGWVGNALLERLRGQPSFIWTALRDRFEFGSYERRVRAVWTLEDPLPGVALVGRFARRGAKRLARRAYGAR